MLGEHHATMLRAVATLVVALALLEGSLAILLSRPHWLPATGFLLDGVRSIYLREDWSVPQMDLDAVAWDPGLTYLLRPGPTRFANREFDTTLAGNSAGLRDDPASLVGPDLIVLGDSFSMGWGVEQDETYAQVLERRTGLRVLNAAMSSYGTARQVLLLERLDVTRARAVVVQYFANDFEENRAYVEDGFALSVTPEEDFTASARAFERQTRYRPLDYLVAFLDRSPYFPELEAASPMRVADACLEVLDSAAGLGNLPIFFLQIDSWPGEDWTRFNILDATSALLATQTYAGLRGRLRFVRLDGVLTAGDFFRLDPHMRPRGHEKVAAELERALAGAGLLRAAAGADKVEDAATHWKPGEWVDAAVPHLLGLGPGDNGRSQRIGGS